MNRDNQAILLSVSSELRRISELAKGVERIVTKLYETEHGLLGKDDLARLQDIDLLDQSSLALANYTESIARTAGCACAHDISSSLATVTLHDMAIRLKVATGDPDLGSQVVNHGAPELF